jgi:hypothetical protein
MSKDKENFESSKEEKAYEESNLDKVSEEEKVKANEDNTKTVEDKKEATEETIEEKTDKTESDEKAIEEESDKKEESAVDETDESEENFEETESYKKASFKERLSLKFRKRLIVNKMHTLGLVVFLLLIFVFVNYLAQKNDLAQIDVTSEKLYSLTDASKSQLENLDKDVNLYAYGFESSSYYTSYITLMKQYAAFNDHINFEIVDESTNYEAVTTYSLSSYTAAVAIVCGEKSKVLSVYNFYDYDSNYNEIDVSEECITNAILNVTTDDPVKIYFATGNGEYTTDSLSTLVSYLKAQVYECDELNLLTSSQVPEDCDILVIMNPTVDFTEEQANSIIDYVNKGGNIFFDMVKENNTTDFSNLQKVLDLYGVSVEYGLLYEGDGSHYYASGNSGYPYILVPNVSSSNEITSEISSSGLYVVAPWSQSLNITDVEEDGVSVTSSALLSTSSKCYNVTDFSKSISLDSLEANKYVIGSELTRTVTTTDENGEETSTTSTLMAFSCTGLFLDKEPATSYSAISNYYTANPDIALNTFASLADQEDLITVTKISEATSFETTAIQDRIVQVIIFGVPVIIIILGIVVWQHRKRKR